MKQLTIVNLSSISNKVRFAHHNYTIVRLVTILETRETDRK